MKILIADDDPVSRRLLQSYLQKWGFIPVRPTSDHGDLVAVRRDAAGEAHSGATPAR